MGFSTPATGGCAVPPGRNAARQNWVHGIGPRDTAYHTAGRIASALQLYEQACSGYERVLGADHPDTLACRANLAHAYYTTGRLTDATALLRDTAARCERVLPRGDQLTRSVQESLASIAGG